MAQIPPNNTTLAAFAAMDHAQLAAVAKALQDSKLGVQVQLDIVDAQLVSAQAQVTALQQQLHDANRDNSRNFNWANFWRRGDRSQWTEARLPCKGHGRTSTLAAFA